MRNLLLTLVLVATSLLANASNASLFQLNESDLNSEFSELNQLELIVENDASMNFEMALTKNLISENMVFNNSLNTMQDDFVMQWEGFLWGFLCCPIGFFVVAVNKNKTKNDKLSFWIGVAAGTVVSAITNAMMAAATVNSSTY